MATDSAGDEFIYRAMVEENGMPRLGESATKLGVRQGVDIEVDGQGMVHRPSFQAGGKNGVSCSPSIPELPSFSIPLEWGGSHPRTKVWKIRKSDLDPDLVAKQDQPRHISIGPSRTMRYDEYAKAIQATAPKWIKVSKGSGG